MTTTKPLYSELLHDRFKSLGYFADEAINGKTSFESLKIVVEYIVPLIAQVDALRPLYCDWLLSKDDYKEEYDRLYKECQSQVALKLESLKLSLEQENLLQHPSIRYIFDSNATNLAEQSFKEVEGLIKSLCYCILKLGREDLLKGYATTRISDQYLFVSNNEGHILQAYNCCDCGYVYDDSSALKDLDGNLIPFDKLEVTWVCPICRCKTDFQIYEYRISSKVIVIDEFVFAPSIIKFDELGKVFSWDRVQDAWVALDFLLLLKWCWDTPLAFFDDIMLDYKNIKVRSQSLRYLNLHSLWAAVNVIKTQQSNPEKVYFFTKDRTVRYVKLIMNEVILYQETIGNLTGDVTQPIPYSIEIRLDGLYFLLDVLWDKNDAIETYIIQEFFVKSGSYEFIRSLLDTEVGIPVTTDADNVKISGLTVAKCLARMHFHDIFAKIFFIKRTTNTVVLRSKKVLLADIKGVSLIKLCKTIRVLEKFC